MLNGRFIDIDFLETPRQRVIFLEDAAIFGIGRRADALELTRSQRGFEKIRRIEGAAGCRTRADQCMNLVDKQDRLRVGLQLL